MFEKIIGNVWLEPHGCFFSHFFETKNDVNGREKPPEL